MSQLLDSTPRADGFHMPGEHEPQERVLMAWPESPENWREEAVPAQQAYAAVASAISEVTPVTLCVSTAQYPVARRCLPPGVELLEIPSNDSWMRDIGPTYVVNGAQRRGVDWVFNAWGGDVNGLYEDWDDDDAMAARLLAYRGEDRYRAPMVMEGGALHVDGEGTLYTTQECLRHPGRNPQLSREEIETLLADFLGIEKIIWLKQGLYNDETDGHVDNLLHVARPGEVLLTWCDDAQDPMYDICREALAVLHSSRDARGREIIVHKLPLPGPLYVTAEEAAGVRNPDDGLSRTPGERLAGSYANFLITNGLIVYPLLDEATDAQAAAVLADVFPQYRVVGVPGREILLGGGNIHCITQQVPALPVG
tara:strand:- start:40265 stop:41365 length:1101 start_codon:yes stop_codon:yes gene_type:complete